MQKELSTYLKLCTQYYDLEKHPYDAQAMAFYMQYAAQAQGSILEPMCGTGRFLIPMLQAGYDIEGFDASPFMLEALHEKCPDARAWLQFIQDFSSPKLYHLIFVPYGSWGLVTDKQQSYASLENMYKHLAVGGKFIVDIDTIYSVTSSLGIWHRALNKREDGSYIALNTCSHFDATTQIFSTVCRYESIRNTEIELIENEDFTQYLYGYDEFDELLRKVGFSTIIKYQDHYHTPATDTRSPLLVYECIK